MHLLSLETNTQYDQSKEFYSLGNDTTDITSKWTTPKRQQMYHSFFPSKRLHTNFCTHYFCLKCHRLQAFLMSVWGLSFFQAGAGWEWSRHSTHRVHIESQDFCFKVLQTAYFFVWKSLTGLNRISFNLQFTGGGKVHHCWEIPNGAVHVEIKSGKITRPS